MLDSFMAKRKNEGTQGLLDSYGMKLPKSSSQKSSAKKRKKQESSSQKKSSTQKQLDLSMFKNPEKADPKHALDPCVHEGSFNAYISFHDENARSGFEDDVIDMEEDDENDDEPFGEDLTQKSLLAKSESFGAMFPSDMQMVTSWTSEGLYLSNYYQQVFPFDVIVDMITLGGEIEMPFCEVVMIVNGKWWRHKIFQDAKSFRNLVINVAPSRLEIGPIHTLPYRGSKREFKINYRRHLVIDMDIEDKTVTKPGYLRWCPCSGFKSSCDICWIFVQVGLKILNHLLKTSFGFKHLLKVYSGRRGAHIWILDRKTIEYTRSQRESVIGYLDKFKNPSTHWDKNSEIVFREVLMPAFKKAYLKGNGLCQSEVAKYVCDRIPKDEARLEVISRWVGIPKSGIDRWFVLEEIVEERISKDMLNLFTRQVVFGLLWPRLDKGVTIELNHLVKSPFVVHPGTNNVCTPIPDDNWTPSQALPKEMVIGAPGVLKPYIEHARKVVKEAYGQK